MRPHVVCFPFPMQGHIIPMTQLANFLCLQGFHVTLVHTSYNLHRLLKSHHSESHPSDEDDDQHAVQMIAIDDGLPDDHRTPAHAIEQFLGSENSTFVQNFNSLIDKLMALQNDIPDDFETLKKIKFSQPSCIISDAILSWTHHTAQRLHIPRIALWTNCLSSWLPFNNIPLLFEKGFMPFDGDVERSAIVDCLSGLPSIYRLTDLPPLFQIPDLSHPVLQFIIRQMELCKQADWILCNTIETLEEQVILEVSKDYPVLAIGPLLASTDMNLGQPSVPTMASLWTRDMECLKWLDSQAKCSVLYVAFGSITCLPVQVIEQIALGLLQSGVPFLWAFREDFSDGKSENSKLSKELLEELSQKGLLVPWVPQTQVLAHDAVGGFVTHCGWNSILESVYMGVPMLGWPLESEQRMNCKMMAQLWQVGWELDFSQSDSIAEQVMRLVRALMMGEESQNMRVNAQRLSKSIREAMTSEDGSQDKLESIVHYLCKKASSNSI